MSLVLSSVAVLYLGVVALVAGLAFAGAPLLPAARAGQATSLVLVAAVVVVDVVSLLRGHRPGETATHLGYVAAAVVVPVLALAPVGEKPLDDAGPTQDRISLALIVISSLVTAVVVVRLAQTWAS